MRATLLAVVAAVVPMRGAFADEIALRCDWTLGPRRGDVAIISIDTTRNTVHEGTDPDSGWYIDGRQIQLEDSGDDNAWRQSFTKCTYSVKQYVRISDTNVTWGVFGANTNSCEERNTKKPGEKIFDRQYIIDRITGIYKIGVEQDSPIWLQTTYQCQRFSGKAF
jgi:hypothetical protein